MRINHNIAALNTYNKLGVNNNAMSKNMEKLSSGLRINRAADDAAGLSISEKMRAQIRGLDQASKNAQDGISLIQTAEGGLNETHDILQRMNELATQGANGTLEPDDRKAINDELKQLTSEVDRIANSANFNGKKLLDGSLDGSPKIETNGISAEAFTDIDVSNATKGATYTINYTAESDDGSGNITPAKYTLQKEEGGNTEDVASINAPAAGTASTLDFGDVRISLTADATSADLDGKTITTKADDPTKASINIQIGANTTDFEKLEISVKDMTSSGLKINDLNVDTEEDAKKAMDSLKEAITAVSAQRSELGAHQNRLEHSINNLNTTSENLTSAESRIRDVDMAKEMMEQTKNSILAQASQAMLTQANQQPQNVLQMLR
ncbi:flagellin [Bacillus endophyticus]|uniref:flagellin N-terminal helical domain-containing protein n=1 Tax=Priestia endophytica TaxID=135735 RepID=UPI0018CC95B5|nr:flagellin [Priestia endophytica]MBG9814558.1 flagellin [Priestia endophytica]